MQRNPYTDPSDAMSLRHLLEARAVRQREVRSIIERTLEEGQVSEPIIVPAREVI